MRDNFYNILEVPETATVDEIKKAYRRLSLIHHPDKNNNSAESATKFQKISEAYETLGDVDKKREYDMMRNNPFIKMMGGNHGMPMDPNVMSQNAMGQNAMDDLLASLFGFSGMGFPPGQGQGHSQGFPPGFHMQGMPPAFHMQGQQGFPSGFGPNVRVFHNGRPVNMAQQQKPAPIIMTIIVPIDKILSGTTVPIDVERWVLENGNKVHEHETIYVTVPKGVDEGEIIVLKDKGNAINDELRGDVKVVIKVENNTGFQRSGLDLIMSKSISIKEALCGFTFELKYITGRTYTINNNAGNIIPNGYKKIIPSMGFTRDGHTGNLVIVFDVKFPEKLSDDALDALKKIEF
jgi:DnaJ-class molecular chaperone